MKRLFLLILLVLFTNLLHAQDDLTIVYVTTQDNLHMRLGPGENWESLVVIPHSTTLLATGRSVRSDWIQVAYEGVLDEGVSTEGTIDGVTYGWLFSDYLIWTGDVLSLAVDGVPTAAFGRMTPLQTGLSEGRVYYREIGDFANPIVYHGETVTVELTGRVGSTDNGYFWLQFRYNGAYYWYPTWMGDPPSGYRQLLDGSYLYSYGKTYMAMRMLSSDATSVLYDIGQRWEDLESGYATTCNNIPAQLLLPEDIYNDESPFFSLPRATLIDTVAQINIAIAKLEEICNRPIESRFATPEDVEIALEAVDNARAQLDLLRLLLPPLASRDPVAYNPQLQD
jgi:hypothetical protein